MIDFNTARVRSHRRNIERYCRLLATELTDLERQYLHKRIAEEHWPAPGSEDTELGVLMELEVGHGETEVYPRVQA
jgi:hypothetical protein